jgi:hypothetical protein
MRAGKTRSPFLGDGRERLHRTLGGSARTKVRSLPPILVFCPRADSLPSVYASAYFSSACCVSLPKATLKSGPKVTCERSVTAGSRRHDHPVVPDVPEAWCVRRSCIDLKAGVSLFLEMAGMVVTGSEFEINPGDFHFLRCVLDAQIRETDFPVNNGKVQLPREGFLHPLCLSLAFRLGLTEFSIKLLFQLVIKLNAKYLAAVAFDLVGSVVIQTV